MKKYTVQLTNVRDGLSDDPNVAPITTFFDGSNVDIRTNPAGVQLSPSIIDEDWVFDSPCLGMVDLSNYGKSGILTYHSNGKVFLNGVLKFNFGSSTADSDKKIYNVAIRSDANIESRIYFFGNQYIHVSDIDLTTGLTDYYTIGSNFDAISRPVLITGEQMIFGVGQGVYLIDGLIANETSGALVAKYAYDNGLKVSAITYSGSMWRIYVTQGNWTSGNSYIYTTDLKQKQPTAIYPMESNPVRNAINVGNIDYVITGSNENYSELYKASGWERILVKKGLETEWSGRFKFYHGINHACNRRDRIFIVGKQSGNIGIFSYGWYYPGISPAAINFDHTIVPNGMSGDITSIMPSTNHLYVGYTLGGVNRVWKIALQYPAVKYSSRGEYITNTFNAGSFYPKKTLETIVINFDLSEANGHSGSIELYMSVNNEEWAHIGTYTTRDDRFAEIFTNNIPKRDFYDLKFKYVLNSGNDNADSPVCMGVSAIYYPILK